MAIFFVVFFQNPHFARKDCEGWRRSACRFLPKNNGIMAAAPQNPLIFGRLLQKSLCANCQCVMDKRMCVERAEIVLHSILGHWGFWVGNS
jgi:hypothetical protein